MTGRQEGAAPTDREGRGGGGTTRDAAPLRGTTPGGAPHRGTTPGGAPSRFPSMDVLDYAPAWDDATRRVVLARLEPTGPTRYFTEREAALADRLFDVLLDQRAEPRVPVTGMVDARLAEDSTDGWHYADLPRDAEAFRVSLAQLDEAAQAAHGTGFAEIGFDDSARIVGHVAAHDDAWRGLPANRLWSLWTRYACTAFYSHPWAWNEIGFPGPAYPRGYGALGVGKHEPWEPA